MSKKHFIALANTIVHHNEHIRSVFGCHADRMLFSAEAIDALATFCTSQNGRFDRGRWLTYIAGECGPNGGKR